MTKTYSSDLFTSLLRSEGLPMPLTEHRFHGTRRWRFDYAWPEHQVALEVEGGVWVGGRHTSGAGFVKDMEKYNEAACMGWRIIRCQPRQLCTMQTVETLRRALRWQ